MKNVVACIDGASYTESVCDYAAWAATRLAAPLELLHVFVPEANQNLRVNVKKLVDQGAEDALIRELAVISQRQSSLALEYSLQMLEKGKQRAQAAGVADVGTRQRHGEYVDTLISIQDDSAMYVMGQHDYQAKPRRLFIDHNLEGALKALKRPVLVASDSSFKQPKRFMLAFDGSAASHKVVDLAIQNPLLQGLSCTIVSVGQDIEEQNKAAERLKQAGFEVQSEWLEGEPADVLVSHAQDNGYDLVVMGAYGQSRIRYLVVGSTTLQVLRDINLPVLILR